MSSVSVRKVNSFGTCPPLLGLTLAGEMLASAGDDGNVLLWIPSDSSMTALGDENSEDKETWRVIHMCRSSTGAEIYDLAWSPDGIFFITGGVDNTARIFNAHTGMHNANL
jgi:chromatin assembly factor 1 subunit B